MSEKKLNGTVIVTYRCNARCSMCSRYKKPSRPDEEISIETIKKLPKMYFTNITEMCIRDRCDYCHRIFRNRLVSECLGSPLGDHPSTDLEDVYKRQSQVSEWEVDKYLYRT